MKYKATQSVGQFLPGEFVEGLSDERTKALLDMGAIVAVEGTEQEVPEKPTRRTSAKTVE